MKRQPPKRWFLLIVLVALAAAGIWFLTPVAVSLFRPFQLEIRNLSGANVTDVRVLLQRSRDGWKLERSIGQIADEHGAIVETGTNDWGYRLEFTLNGRALVVDDPYVDLWTGECWLIQIKSDGSTEAGYASVLRRETLKPG